jgi:DNA replication and repair protein RecF
MERREKEIDFFSSIFNSLYENVSGICGIKIKYRKSWKSDSANNIINELRENRMSEIHYGLTRTGPHRDNYIFMKESCMKEFDHTASTGQKRLLALILRTAQALRCFEMTNREPVLLLDDVLLELDGKKKINFLQLLPPYKQAFYTFLPEERFDEYRKSDTIVYYVQEGNLIHEDNK